MRTLLEWARHSENAAEFIQKVELTSFSSKAKQTKLKAFRVNLERANGGEPVSDEDLLQFLRHFHLLGYDLDISFSCHSVFVTFSNSSTVAQVAASVWAQIVDEVQSTNKNAGTITTESLPDEVRRAFTQPPYVVIPKALAETQPSPIPDWSHIASLSDITWATLLGSWHEKHEDDRAVTRELNGDFSFWINAIRETLQQPENPFRLRNGAWSIADREALWQSVPSRIFDMHLDTFKQCATRVLSGRDLQFELPPTERYAATIRGKVLRHSRQLRKGLAESLALLGIHSELLHLMILPPEKCSPVLQVSHSWPN